MDLKEIFTLIGNYAFPMVLCVMLLTTTNKQIETMKSAIDANTSVLKELIIKLEADK